MITLWSLVSDIWSFVHLIKVVRYYPGASADYFYLPCSGEEELSCERRVQWGWASGLPAHPHQVSSTQLSVRSHAGGVALLVYWSTDCILNSPVIQTWGGQSCPRVWLCREPAVTAHPAPAHPALRAARSLDPVRGTSPKVRMLCLELSWVSVMRTKQF